MELPGMGVVTVLVGVVGAVALVAAAVGPARERASGGYLLGMGIVSLAVAFQIALAALQSRAALAAALVPLLLAGVVVLVRGARTRRVGRPAVDL